MSAGRIDRRTRIARLGFFLCMCMVLPRLPAESIRVASYNLKSLGAAGKDYVTLAKVVSRFDVVAAGEIANEGGVEKLVGALGDDWEAAMSGKPSGAQPAEASCFFYRDRIELLKMLGDYPGRGQFSVPPCGAQFKDRDSRLTFNLVACRMTGVGSERARRDEIDRLGAVYRYFERLTGNRGITIIAGDFQDEKAQDFETLLSIGSTQVIPWKATTIGAKGPERKFDHMFVSETLRPRVQKADVLYWTTDFEGTRRTVSDHFPVYVVLK